MSTSTFDIVGSRIHIGPDSLDALSGLLNQADMKDVKKFILVDEQTLQLCLPILMTETGGLSKAEIIEIESGEGSKNIEVCANIWRALSEMEADRSSVMLNLGGGVITDMGGFIASCYMRGIRFINIPTTLLAQVDASIGGKTGVDLDNLKNHIGVFNDPESVIISTKFLRSLGKRQLLAGFAEMLKHALICDRDYWHELIQLDFSDVEMLDGPIARSIEIKKEIVEQDQLEQSARKALNFGHTVGHAVESFSMETQNRELLHGEAVAIGMICEAFLSSEHGALSKEGLESITTIILGYYEPFPIEEIDHNRIIEIMRHDKKNKDGELNFTFLTGIGSHKVDQTAHAQEVTEALNYYRIMSSQS